jgi:hypothetical protein
MNAGRRSSFGISRRLAVYSADFLREAIVDSHTVTLASEAPLVPEIAAGTPASLARAWLWLGVMALIGSGLLAVLLVLSRTPGIQDVFPLKDLFRAALVVHVDLSVAVWFMAFAAVIWCAVGAAGLAWLGWSGFALAALATALMTVSPFFPGAEPVLNNYIPVLKQPLFFTSLWIFAVGITLTVMRALITTWPQRFLGEPLRLGAFLGAVAAFLALAAFYWSWLLVPEVEGTIYYEVMFWGGGHTLQFQHALLMVVAWLWIAAALGRPSAASPRAVSVLFLVAALPLLAVPAIYLLLPVGELPHVELFAKLMEWGHPYMGPLILLGACPCGACAPARGAGQVGVCRFLHAVCAWWCPRLHDPRRQRRHSGALSRFDGRRHAGLHGPGLRAPATPRLRRARGTHGALAALRLWRRATDSCPRPGLVGRLRRAAQGRRCRADADHLAAEDRHGDDGPRRPDCRYRRPDVRSGVSESDVTAARAGRRRWKVEKERRP